MPISITWSLKGDIVSSGPTMTTTMLGRQASMLVISSVDYQHSGVYTCRAENTAGIATYSAELKVNGNWKLGGTYGGIFYLQNTQLRDQRPGKLWSVYVCRDLISTNNAILGSQLTSYYQQSTRRVVYQGA